MRAFYSKVKEPKLGSWSLGMIAVADFRNPPSAEVEECSVFVLDEVVRQTDQVFLDFLTRLRNGALEDIDVEFIVSRMLDNLSDEEQLTFGSKNSLQSLLSKLEIKREVLTWAAPTTRRRMTEPTLGSRRSSGLRRARSRKAGPSILSYQMSLVYSN
jgi:hypothetical protein